MIQTIPQAGTDKFGVHESVNGIVHKDDFRDDKRMIVEVDVAPSNGTIVCRQYVPHGKHKIVLYESDEAELSSLVQSDADRAAWAVAEEAHETRMGEYICQAMGIRTTPDRANAAWREAAAVDAKAAEAAETAKRRYHGHPSIEFARANPRRKHGIPPLRSAKPIERGIVKPDTPATRVERQESTNTALLSKLADAIESLAKNQANGRRG